MQYQGLFKRYDLHGRNWLRFVSQEDRAAFSYIGRSHAAHGHMGGTSRASSARRDAHGRFVGSSYIGTVKGDVS